ncbi:MAG: hypothetical protein ACR2GH_21480 [Pseudonocardia sp.]
MTTTLAAHPTGPGPRAALRAEHTKFWSVRTLPGLAVTALVTAVVMALLFAVSLPITQGTAIADLAPTTVVEAALVGVDVAAVVLIVLGALFMGSEYSSGLAQPTFILTPRRGRVLLARRPLPWWSPPVSPWRSPRCVYWSVRRCCWAVTCRALTWAIRACCGWPPDRCWSRSSTR